MTHQPPCVCHEPEPVARVWDILREELNLYLLHADRQRVYDVFAHEFAEQIRAAWTAHDPKKPGNVTMLSALNAADLIDPETQP